jgi:hypothetical protein
MGQHSITRSYPRRMQTSIVVLGRPLRVVTQHLDQIIRLARRLEHHVHLTISLSS